MNIKLRSTETGSAEKPRIKNPGRRYGPSVKPLSWNIEDIVAELRTSREETHNIRHRGQAHQLPSRAIIERFLDKLVAALFPTHLGPPNLKAADIDRFVRSSLQMALATLSEQVRRALLLATTEGGLQSDAATRIAEDIVRGFSRQLPTVRGLLANDLLAAYEGDPAATTMPEILLGYPGMPAVVYHRLARVLYLLGVPLIARLMSHIAHSKTGIDIHPGAEIGPRFFIDHGTGVVIGETAIIGQRVRLYQAVTLGAKRFPIDGNGAVLKGHPRHPIVEDDVVIYAGATILGRITIGRGSVIGGNVWLTQSVPAGSNITQATMRRNVDAETA